MQNQGNVITRAFSKFVSVLNSAGGILIFAMIVMINLDVFSRFLFNHPIDGVTELVELSIVAIVFLQLSDAVRNGRRETPFDGKRGAPVVESEVPAHGGSSEVMC